MAGEDFASPYEAAIDTELRQLLLEHNTRALDQKIDLMFELMQGQAAQIAELMRRRDDDDDDDWADEDAC